MQALIINKKSPKVTMVMGRVKMTNSGFTKKFKTLITKATIMAVV